MEIDSALERFVSEYVKVHQEQQIPLVNQFDSAWVSPCSEYQGEQDEWVPWLPVKQNNECHFDDFENALDIKMNPELARFFTCYFSDNLNAHTKRGDLQLLMPWNKDDFERLQQNLIAHVLMKRRLGQDDTLFFAVTDEEDFIISVHNPTGNVVLEQVGLEPKEILAQSLTQFVSQLRPKLI
ncbi:SecY-interacting protein [Aliiglaciecola sp. M165]|uniref:SecY-interacting protein n=1 Tax=Aliiglaciecola sp. M165 TaxID=2593649 RepID=UPI00117BF629|nr:SecY-interacting protein [Aliiglaciecola sp. M165]TRY30789.1 SecY-interacting protein [Aliiglaciecola sp. M165]